MSQTFRNKLFDEIEKNVGGEKIGPRLGGTYFNYGEYRLHKDRWEAELKQKLATQLKKGTNTRNSRKWCDVKAVP